MRIRNLLNQWDKQAEHYQDLKEYTLRLPRYELAKIYALKEMYPGKEETELLADLLVSALHALEEAFPYTPGDRIVAEDENGDPIYEDIGPTPRFLALTRKYAAELEAE
jgi:hypothetical protein